MSLVAEEVDNRCCCCMRTEKETKLVPYFSLEPDGIKICVDKRSCINNLKISILTENAIAKEYF